MEWNMLPFDGKKNSMISVIDKDMIRFQVPWQVFFVFVALEFVDINHFLFFSIITKLFIDSLSELL